MDNTTVCLYLGDDIKNKFSVGFNFANLTVLVAIGIIQKILLNSLNVKIGLKIFNIPENDCIRLVHPVTESWEYGKLTQTLEFRNIPLSSAVLVLVNVFACQSSVNLEKTIPLETFKEDFLQYLKRPFSDKRKEKKLISQLAIHYISISIGPVKKTAKVNTPINLVGLIEFIETLDSKSVKKLHGIDTVLGGKFTEEFKARIIGNIQEYIHTLNNESI